MNGLGVAVLMGSALLVGGAIANRLRIPAPLVLLVIGLLGGFVPLLGSVSLPPDLVLLLFLPALLYWESLNMSPREIKRNLRVITLSAVPLVLATVAVVAWVATGFGLPWPVAIVLGAIVAPTDATAVASFAGRLPRRTLTVLRGESLINDGTALAVYAVAVSAVEAQRAIDLGQGVLVFLLSYAGGVTIGIAIAALAVGVRRLIAGQSLLENTMSVLTPFAAYLPAELLHVSGVLAVVTCGLILSHFGPRIISARTRTQGFGFWQLASWVLNGSLFVLVGFQAHAVFRQIGADAWPAIAFGLVISLALLLSRVAWTNTVPYLIRALDRRPSQRARRVAFRQRTVSMWAGFRGAVSLAAALALARSFPDRSLIIAVTIVVIVVTLFAQGLTMPALVRWARLPVDSTEHDEEILAETAALQAAVDALPAIAERLGTPDDVALAMRHDYADLLEHMQGPKPRSRLTPGPGEDAASMLRREILRVKREAMISTRDRGEIDDTVLRRLQARLDIEELRLDGVAVDE